MAVPGKTLDESTRRMIERMTDSGFSRRKTAAEAGVCKRTVDKYAKRQQSGDDQGEAEED